MHADCAAHKEVIYQYTELNLVVTCANKPATRFFRQFLIYKSIPGL